jgi:hypothetical protein
MFSAGTPAAITFRAISAITSGVDIAPGAPEQFALMPTTSEGAMNFLHASASFFAPVSACMPREIIASR